VRTGDRCRRHVRMGRSYVPYVRVQKSIPVRTAQTYGLSAPSFTLSLRCRPGSAHTVRGMISHGFSLVLGLGRTYGCKKAYPYVRVQKSIPVRTAQTLSAPSFTLSLRCRPGSVHTVRGMISHGFSLVLDPGGVMGGLGQ